MHPVESGAVLARADYKHTLCYRLPPPPLHNRTVLEWSGDGTISSLPNLKSFALNPRFPNTLSRDESHRQSTKEILLTPNHKKGEKVGGSQRNKKIKKEEAGPRSWRCDLGGLS